MVDITLLRMNVLPLLLMDGGKAAKKALMV